MKSSRYSLLVLLLGALCLSGASIGCSVAGPAADEINPYGQGNSVSTLGNRDSSALNGAGGGGSKQASNARQALEVMGTYRRAQAPQPSYPVVKPAEVRMMWIPDHVNRHGDLVPAHYYYLRVMNWRWNVQDAFEIEEQYQNNSGVQYAPTSGGGGGAAPAPGSSYGTNGTAGSTPWVYKEE